MSRAITDDQINIRPITMQDVRLAVGEGKLTPDDVLAGCNAEIRRRGGLTFRKPITDETVEAMALAFMNEYRSVKYTAVSSQAVTAMRAALKAGDLFND